jgi:L,D-peptidoglycan transpeptidase YkuD (ErfK/YbiS/YcfS/YnhG family)
LSLAARFADERGQEHRTAGCVAAWMENLKRIVGEVRPGIDIMPT